MAKFLKQDTFDEVVKENMEDFGMDREAAAKDAVEQFKSQGQTNHVIELDIYYTTRQLVLR